MPAWRFALGTAIALMVGGLASDWRSTQVPIGSARAADAIRISVPIKNRTLANERQRFVRVAQGDLLELVFTSDEAAELHLHGYDIHLTVDAGRPAVLRVDAKIAGRFPLESHRFGSAPGEQATAAHSHATLLYLEVYPK